MPLFHRWHGSILAFALALSGLSFGQTPATPPTSITAGDLLQVKVLEAPALSPDGAWVVYTVRSIEPKSAAPDEWVYHTHLWLAATDGSQPARQLTRNATQNSAPDWHPDGRRIAFVRGSDTPGEKPQIHVLSLDGGEAVAWTQLETGAGAPQWSPDGRRLMFQSTLSEAQLRAALENAIGVSWRQRATILSADYASGSYVDESADMLALLARTLGQPDYNTSTQESIDPTAVFSKLVADGVRKACRDGLALDAARPRAERILVRHAEIGDTATSNPAGVRQNLAYLALRFWARPLRPDSPEVTALFDVFRVASTAPAVPEESLPAGTAVDGWRAVCIALATDPQFLTY
jgi:hypothetical protein